MSETTTTKTLNLYQLGQEIGGSPSFRLIGPDDSGSFILRSDCDQAALEAAVAGHVADDSIQPPLTADELAAVEDEERRSIVDQAISDAIAELLALAAAPALPVVPTIPTGTFTTAQLSDYIRAIRNVIAAQRDENQATRAGAQRAAETLANKIRLDRGDFAHLDD